jgi:glycosyltransferase involved in cell wall biosynthesis
MSENKRAQVAKIPISAIVLTYNEEKNIEKCLDSVVNWADEIIVVDSFSNDNTLEIANKFTSKIYQNKYDGHPQQWQWTLDNVSSRNDWIFAIDADFIVTDSLWEDLQKKLESSKSTFSGFYIRHKQIFKGRPILHGGIYPNYWLRVFKKNEVWIDKDELVDVHFYVDGKTEKIEYDVEEINCKDDSISFWIQKQNSFARKHAIEEIKRREKTFESPDKISYFGNPNQRKLFLKSIWYKLPLYWRPFMYFFYRYFLRGGFLDGKEGFIYHFTQGFLYRMLVDINIDEILNQAKKI